MRTSNEGDRGASSECATLNSLIGCAAAELAGLPRDDRHEVIDCLVRWGFHQAAAEALDAVAESEGDSLWLLDQQAAVMAAQRRFAEVLVVGRRRLELSESLTVLKLLTTAHLERGELAEAAAVVAQARARGPERAAALCLQGDLAAARQEHAAAEAFYAQVLAARAGNTDALIGLAHLQAARGDLHAACQLLEQRLAAWAEGDLGSGFTRVALRRCLAALYVRAGRPEQARAVNAALKEVLTVRLARLRNRIQQMLATAGSQPEWQSLETSAEAAGPALSPPRAAWPPDLALQRRLMALFGYSSFRPCQEEVVQNVLHGISTLAVMPTGAGKSLCYQLAAMLLPRATLVISPLIALMKDQHDSLPLPVQEATTVINSSLESDDLESRLNAVSAGQFKLVYAAPERLRQRPFLHALAAAGISLLAVDEAHCVSLWGHDFRPDYLFIRQALAELGGPPLLATTATASPVVAAAIGRELGRSMAVVQASVFRPNLRYEVLRVANREEKMRRLLEICQQQRGAGIVYVNSRERAEELADLLRRNHVVASFYHAGLGTDERASAQEHFMADHVRVMVATIAFGMGVDKRNIRFIVHFNPSESLESYVQESGRAGRDGQPACCTLLYSPADKSSLTRWLHEERMRIETLRSLYRGVRARSAGGFALLPADDLLRDLGEAVEVQARDDTLVRVGLAYLERAGLLVRHLDLPRAANVRWPGERVGVGEDEDFARFVAQARLRPGQVLTLSASELSQRSGLSPLDLEERLLLWRDRGWLAYRGSARDMLLELLPPPSDVASALPAMLAQHEREQERRLAHLVEYAISARCRHASIAAHFGERIATPCGACDVCAPARGSSAPHASQPRPEVGEGEPVDPSHVALTCVGKLPFAVGKRGLVRILSGSVASPIKGDRCPQFGSLAHLRPAAIETLIERLVTEGSLAPDDHNGYRVLRLTGKGRQRLSAGADEHDPI